MAARSGCGLACGVQRLHVWSAVWLQIIAVSLPVDEISGMREMFLEIDKDKSGTITVDEFRDALRRKGAVLGDSDIKRIMDVSVRCVCVGDAVWVVGVERR